MELDDETTWVTKTLDTSSNFAAECRVFCDENPSNHMEPLNHIMLAMMTELWDRQFSQSEIRSAFQSAIDDLPRYAADEDRRS